MRTTRPEIKVPTVHVQVEISYQFWRYQEGHFFDLNEGKSTGC